MYKFANKPQYAVLNPGGSIGGPTLRDQYIRFKDDMLWIDGPPLVCLVTVNASLKVVLLSPNGDAFFFRFNRSISQTLGYTISLLSSLLHLHWMSPICCENWKKING